MAYCEHCGAAITTGAKFCSYCGAAIQVSPVTVSAAQVITNQQAAGVAIGDYSVVLLSTGSCGRSTAICLIMDACGYEQVEAQMLADAAPVTLAQDLPRVQAVCLAQALTEKGMEVALRDSSGYQELIETEDESIFDKLGNFIASAAATLRLIGARHRVPRTSIRRMDLFMDRNHRPPVLRVQHRHPVPAPVAPVPPAPVRRPSPVKPGHRQEVQTRPAQRPGHHTPGQPGGPQRPDNAAHHDGPGGRGGRR